MGKHKVRVITLLVATVLAFSSVVGLSPHAQVAAQSNQGNAPGEFANGDIVVVASATLNLREEPGRNTTMITSLSAGDEATILDGPVRATGLDWYQINASGDIGWVAGDYLDLASAGAMFNDGDTVYVYDGPINFRDGPGLTYDPIGILPQDQIATVIGIPVPDIGYEWYELDIDGDGFGDGWAAGEFLATYTGIPPVITPGAFPTGSYVFVNTPKLHLRSGDSPSLESPVLQTLRDGEIATVVGGPSPSDGYNWYQLEVGSDTGWAAGEFLTGGVTVEVSAVVADGPVNLRAKTNQNGTILATLQPGDVVTVISGPINSGGTIWFEVNYAGTPGYVVGRYLGPA